jgi:tetratricopeptide (TPR) repeat protein
MGGFKGAAALPTDADGLAADDQGPILGERPSGRDQEHFDEFVAIAKALELAREHKYADAVKALEASPLPKHESLKGSVALNRQELIEHRRIEERLHAAQYLTLFHRDPVAAVDRLLSDYRKAEEQLHETRSEIARMPKPVDTKPLYQEIERLREAHGLAESRAKRVDGAMKEVREANESAAQALARARAMEERLNATERKLRTAEERLRQPASEPPLSGIFTATPVKFAEPTGEGRSAYQAYTQGLTLYREGRYEEAERFLTQAVRGDSQDARYEYFLGLAELALGKAELADGSFRRGAMLERENRPSHVFVLVALDTVGGEARRQLDRYRTSSPQNSSERQPERPLAPPLSLDRIDTPGSAR